MPLSLAPRINRIRACFGAILKLDSAEGWQWHEGADWRMEEGFFIDNYDHPMFEDGVQLRDMVYLRKDAE